MNVVFQACLLKLTVSVYKVTTGLPIMPCSAVYKLHKQNGCFNQLWYLFAYNDNNLINDFTIVRAL